MKVKVLFKVVMTIFLLFVTDQSAFSAKLEKFGVIIQGEDCSVFNDNYSVKKAPCSDVEIPNGVRSFVINSNNFGNSRKKEMNDFCESFDGKLRDGECCLDSADKEVVNVSKESVETFGPQNYSANAVDVQSVFAEVDIQPVSGNNITVTMKGLKSVIENISVKNRNGVVTVEGNKISGHSRSASISGSISINGDSIGGIYISGNKVVDGFVMQGNSISINSGLSNADVKISIGVPEGSDVKISRVYGNVNVGDTLGSLDVNVSGSDDFRAGNVTNAKLSVQGSGDINVESVNGNLTMNVHGSGDIMVTEGSVNSLNVNVMGSGEVDFKGRAVNANLSIMGSGDIDVACIENRPTINDMGSGDIDVGDCRR